MGTGGSSTRAGTHLQFDSTCNFVTNFQHHAEAASPGLRMSGRLSPCLMLLPKGTFFLKFMQSLN